MLASLCLTFIHTGFALLHSSSSSYALTLKKEFSFSLQNFCCSILLSISCTRLQDLAHFFIHCQPCISFALANSAHIQAKRDSSLLNLCGHTPLGTYSCTSEVTYSMSPIIHLCTNGSCHIGPRFIHSSHVCVAWACCSPEWECCAPLYLNTKGDIKNPYAIMPPLQQLQSSIHT